MTALHDGVRGKDKLDVPIKMIFNYAGNTPHQPAQRHQPHARDPAGRVQVRVHRGVGHLPDRLGQIRPTCCSPTSCAPGAAELRLQRLRRQHGLHHHAASQRPRRSSSARTLYAVLREIADRMGDEGQVHREPADEEGWLAVTATRRCAERPRAADATTRCSRWASTAASDPDGHVVALKTFRDDPEAQPAQNPLGQDRDLLRAARRDRGHLGARRRATSSTRCPCTRPGAEGYDDPLRARPTPCRCRASTTRRARTPSYGCIDVLKQAAPQELWINPIDAEARSIDGRRHGARAQRPRRPSQIVAKVTPRIMPGVVVDGPGRLARRRHGGRQGRQGRLHQHAHVAAPEPARQGQPRSTPTSSRSRRRKGRPAPAGRRGPSASPSPAAPHPDL